MAMVRTLTTTTAVVYVQDWGGGSVYDGDFSIVAF
jgi:hypothetical protein